MPNKIKNGAYAINLNEYKNVETHWIALYCKNNKVIYFVSFSIEHIPKEVKTFIGNKNIKTNIFRLQGCDSIMCGYFTIKFIDFMFKDKSLIEFTNQFSP